ncbi:hypothetical protein [Acinetobacter johnsonii]|jgi:hypothetical protein|uniref:Nucleotidyltransferase n=2 Tax=Acinetobacter johnsonii TaxID=40214 RepID=A0AA42IGU9_ACIJO|nr:hypothetical protein [Acinetobacter johnsonii]MDH0657260.1 hypothetical protein [Acinetobacter johnsonii]MDH1700089.1 hypothetical protein [Acinetobacter johnsonii]
MYIYAFGSICRGEIDFYSDVDLIAISDDLVQLKNLDPNKFSIYSEKRIKEYWEIGNPFAWHLYKESKLIFSSTEHNFLKSLGKPSKYLNGYDDLIKFYNIFGDSVKQLEDTDASFLFDISTIFLSIRNFATCYSLAYGKINFHRYSALNLGDKSIPISIEDYKTLESARLLATRGVGSFPTQSDSIRLIKCFDIIDSWMKSLLGEFK